MRGDASVETIGSTAMKRARYPLVALALGVAAAGAGVAAATAPGTTGDKVKPVIARPVAVPARPVAGGRFALSFKVTRRDTGKLLLRGKMVCNPTVAGKAMRHTESFSGGIARVAFVVPAAAAGSLLKVELTVTAAGGASTTKVASFLVPRSVPPAPPPPPAAPVRVAVTGPPQTVVDWTNDRCELWDIPDLSARAFRDARGQVQLIASHYVTRLSVGADLDHVRHDCTTVFGSHRNADPAAYDDAEWIGATYTEDGTTVYAFVHDEYEGHTHPGQCPSREYGRCWWNTITSAVSTDGGRTYVHGTPPALVATYPYRYVPDQGSYGAMMPSNIVRNDADGYYYALVYVKEQPHGGSNTNHNCLIRTKDLADPSSWRAWSGGATFATTFIDPYRSSADPAAHLCRGVSPDALGDFPLGSLTYVSDAKQWLLVGVAGKGDGFSYSTSTDLVNWAPRRMLLAATAPWTYRCGGPDPVHYPSVLDPASPSRNFETTGASAYLYYTQFHTQNCQQGPDRDLVRVPIAITR